MSEGEKVYHRNPELFSQLTQAQLKNAHKLFKSFLGVQLAYVDPNPHLADQVYTADPGMFHINSDGELVAVLSNFRFKQYRGGEVKHFKDLANRMGATIVQMPDHIHWEGSGDTIAIRDPKTQIVQCYLMGCGPRSDSAAAGVLQAAWGVPVHPVPLHVANSASEQSGFHIDTALMRTGSESGHLVIHRPVVSNEGLKTIQSVIPENLWVDIGDQDAQAMATNGVVLGKKILLHDLDDGVPNPQLNKLANDSGVDLTNYALSRKYLQMLRGIGCDVKTTDLTTIILGGGSGKCGSNPITNAVSPAALEKWHMLRGGR